MSIQRKRKFSLAKAILILAPAIFLLVSCPQPSSSGEEGGDGDSGPSYTPEGSIDNPVEIPPNTTYSGQVDTTKSYYKSWGAASGDNVNVWLTELLDDADLMEYDADSTFTAHPTPKDPNMPFRGRTMIEWTNNGGYSTNDIYFVVDGSYSEAGTTFAIRVYSMGPSLSMPGDRGTPSEPVLFPSGYEWGGGVGTGGTSYYKVATAPGTTYRVNNFDDNVFLTLYNDQFTTPVDGPAANCSAAAAGSFLYIMVQPQGAGVDFDMEVVQGEGSSGTPVPLYTEKINFSQVDEASSYYILETNPGSDYTITVDWLSNDVDVFVYNDSTFTNLVDSGTVVGLGDEVCNVTGAGSHITVRIDNTDSPQYGATYRITVTED